MVREKSLTIPTSGRRWPAPTPQRSCTARRGLRRSDCHPTPEMCKADECQRHSRSRGRARAFRAAGADAKASKVEKNVATPHKGTRGGGGGRAPKSKRTASRLARARGKRRRRVGRRPTGEAATRHQRRGERESKAGVEPEEACHPPPRESRPFHRDSSTPTRVVARAADVATDRK